MNIRFSTREWGWSGLVLGVAALLVLVYLFAPEQSRFYPRCFFNALTGLHCPGCGSTRALHQLLHGEFLAALRCNALLVFLVPLVIVMWAVTRRCGGRSWLEHPKAGWFLAVVVLGFAVLRNLPVAPFQYLAP